MSINRIRRMLPTAELPERHRRAAELLEVVMVTPHFRMMAQGTVQQHPGEQITMVVLHTGVQICRDLMPHIKGIRDEAVAEQADVWASYGLPPLFVFSGGSRMGTQVAQYLAKDEQQAVADFERLRQFQMVGICVAQAGCVMAPLCLVRPDAAERQRRSARRRAQR